MRISDWSSDVCSSDLLGLEDQLERLDGVQNRRDAIAAGGQLAAYYLGRRTLRQDQGHVLVHHRDVFDVEAVLLRKLTQHGGDVVERDLLAGSEEHTSELTSLMRISYAVFCLKKKHNET